MYFVPNSQHPHLMPAQSYLFASHSSSEQSHEKHAHEAHQEALPQAADPRQYKSVDELFGSDSHEWELQRWLRVAAFFLM